MEQWQEWTFLFAPQQEPVVQTGLEYHNADIKVRSARRITRTIVRGQEGDNLHDEGSESTLYTVSGEMKIDEYKKILAMYRSGQPCIHDPFEERDVKVVFASMEYDGSNEMFTFEFIEDII